MDEVYNIYYVEDDRNYFCQDTLENFEKIHPNATIVDIENVKLMINETA